MRDLLIYFTDTFQKKLDESGHKPKKVWVNKGSKFYKKLLKPWYRSGYRNVLNTKKVIFGTLLHLIVKMADMQEALLTIQ